MDRSYKMSDDLYFDTVLNSRMMSIYTGSPSNTRRFLINSTAIGEFHVVEGSSKRIVTTEEYLAGLNGSPSDGVSENKEEKVAEVVLQALTEQQEAIDKVWTFSPKNIARVTAMKIMEIFE